MHLFISYKELIRLNHLLTLEIKPVFVCYPGMDFSKAEVNFKAAFNILEDYRNNLFHGKTMKRISILSVLNNIKNIKKFIDYYKIQ